MAEDLLVHLLHVVVCSLLWRGWNCLYWCFRGVWVCVCVCPAQSKARERKLEVQAASSGNISGEGDLWWENLLQLCELSLSSIYSSNVKWHLKWGSIQCKEWHKSSVHHLFERKTSLINLSIHSYFAGNTCKCRCIVNKNKICTCCRLNAKNER